MRTLVTLTALAPLALSMFAVASAAALTLRVGDDAPAGRPVHTTAYVGFACAVLASLAGYALSPVASAALAHARRAPADVWPVLLMCSVGAQLYAVYELRHAIPWKRVAPFLVGGTPAVLLAAWQLSSSPARFYASAIGVTLSVCGALMLLRREMRPRLTPAAGKDAICGIVAGLLAGVASFPGGAITLWCSLHGGSSAERRAIVQPVILALQLVAVPLLGALGQGPAAHLAIVHLALLPVAVGVAWITLSLLRRLGGEQLAVMVNLLVVVGGASMIAGMLSAR